MKVLDITKSVAWARITEPVATRNWQKSRELIEFAVGKGLTVFALAHPVIPQWCKELPVIPKIIETMA